MAPTTTDKAAAAPAAAYALFDTAVGVCALVWRGSAVSGCLLPEPALPDRVADLHPGAVAAEPPPAAAAAIAEIRRLLNGEPADFDGLELDLAAAAPFERAVYAACAAIPRGEVRTYGELATAIGAPGAARAVGRALGRNPFPIIIPCHRVLAAGGRGGGFSAPGGAVTKFRLLAIEGARRPGGGELFPDLPLAIGPEPLAGEG